jgi:thioredoxin-related protein
MKIVFRLLLFIFFTMLFYNSAPQAADASWLKFDAGIGKATKEEKFVLVDFYTTWCHWCKVMDEKTFQDVKVAQKLNAHFIKVRLNAEDVNESVTYLGKKYTNVEFTQAFGVTGYPSLAFLDSKAKVITLIPGYVPPEEFIQILNYIEQRCYEKQVSFEDFKKTGGCNPKK